MTAPTPQQMRALADRQPRNFPWSADAALRAAADDLDRLRAVIENAPHGYDHICSGDDPLIMTECTCWKADVL